MILIECIEEYERHLDNLKWYTPDRRIKPTHYPVIVVDKFFTENYEERVEFEFVYKEDFDCQETWINENS